MARNRIIPLFLPHAGCPCACVFCDQKKITGMDTPVTPDDVAREIEEALPWAGEGCQLQNVDSASCITATFCI